MKRDKIAKVSMSNRTNMELKLCYESIAVNNFLSLNV